MIYLDNAATSWPKPPAVGEAMLYFLNEVGANPGRSGHRRSVEAARVIYETRAALASFFGLADPLRLIFTPNVTYALNLVLRGLLRPGDHVITSGMEHNAVMRPLRALERQGISLAVVPCSPEGLLDPSDVRRALRPSTRLVVLNHASNVCGTIQPAAEVGQIAREAGLFFLLDAAQTAGVLPLVMDELCVDLLAFTGHKGLLGPTGTGGLAIGPRVSQGQMEPLVRGGTGSRSEYEEQPEFLPDRFEGGTPNTVGLAGLGAAISYVQKRTLEAIRTHEVELTARLAAGLRGIPGVVIQGPPDVHQQVAVISFTAEGKLPSELALQLDEQYEIACRPGLHCAPAAHRTLGTFPGGTVRLSIGPFTTVAEIDKTVRAVAELGGRR